MLGRGVTRYRGEASFQRRRTRRGDGRKPRGRCIGGMRRKGELALVKLPGRPRLRMGMRTGYLPLVVVMGMLCRLFRQIDPTIIPRIAVRAVPRFDADK